MMLNAPACGVKCIPAGISRVLWIRGSSRQCWRNECFELLQCEVALDFARDDSSAIHQKRCGHVLDGPKSRGAGPNRVIRENQVRATQFEYVREHLCKLP